MRTPRVIAFFSLGLVVVALSAALASSTDEDTKKGPECRVSCLVIDVGQLKPGGTIRASYADTLRFRLAKNGGQGSALEDIPDDPTRDNLKHTLSAKTHGPKFPVEVDLSYALEVNGQPKLKIGAERVRFWSQTDSRVIASKDGNHILVVSFAPWRDR